MPNGRARRRVAQVAAVAFLAVAACSGAAPRAVPRVSSPSAASASASPAIVPSTAPAAFDEAAALATVRALAALGPREATSDAYRRAAAIVERRFAALGFRVSRQAVPVPAGRSWGVRVPAGSADNVIAEPPGFDPARPHLIAGAHLDTVPQSPGADDNASGVAVIMELARLATLHPPRLPIVFVAFAAEEPRGPRDDQHHYGSRRYVAERGVRGLLGAVSVDRIGTGPAVRLCTGGRAPATLAERFATVAARERIPVRRCTNRASDHWSFEKAGVPGLRVGGSSHPAYHSPRDVPAIVQADQLRRGGTLAWRALFALGQDDF